MTMRTDRAVAPTTTGALTLTLVRHGHTDLNQRHLLQGWSDSPLTPAGLDGVRTTAQHLADRPFVAAYSSPSGRTIATAAEILRHHDGVPLRTDHDLREYNFGHLEGRPESALTEIIAWPELILGILRGEHPGFPGGEHAATFLGRLRSAMDRIVTAHPDGGEVLVVGHGLALGTWLSLVGAEFVVPANASVTQVRVAQDGVRVEQVGVDVVAPAPREADAAGRAAAQADFAPSA